MKSKLGERSLDVTMVTEFLCEEACFSLAGSQLYLPMRLYSFNSAYNEP